MIRIFSSNKAVFGVSWLIALASLLAAGAFYRKQAQNLNLITKTPVKLPLPLIKLPTTIKGWTGRDIPISDAIQKVVQNDDFVNRLYVNQTTGQWANLYIAYSAHPRTMLGHRPQVCYVSNGWIHDSTANTEVVSPLGRNISCLMHRFHKPLPHHDEIVVLNFYVLNGQVISSESGFSGLKWRSPNISGDPARYVAQIQISSTFENSVRLAARDLIEPILKLLPATEASVGYSESEVSPVVIRQ